MRSPRAALRPSFLTLDTAIAWAIVVATCVCLAYSAGAIHWALVPLGICGALEAPTLVRWLRGRSDAFDLKAVVTLLVFHNTFVAPVLHLRWDWYTPLIRVPQDPWEWFGRLALAHSFDQRAIKIGARL